MIERNMRFAAAAVTALVGLIFGPAAAAEKAPQEVVALANGELAALGTDPVIVKAVKEEKCSVYETTPTAELRC